MKFNLLVDIELFSKFYQNAINGIEVITVVSSCGSEMKDYKVIVFLDSFQGLMVLKPFDQQSLLAYTSVGLND